MLISQSKRDKFSLLFSDFLATYPTSTAGQAHRTLYTQARTVAQANYREIAAASQRGDDITDLVLLKLLPYADTANNRTKGAWIHWAPSINGDIRKWYENKGWVGPQQWHEIALAIWTFIQRCTDTPDHYEAACKEFLSRAYTGFQTGTLTPILNALLPHKFTLVNNKSRNTINYLTDSKHGQNLTDYPAINATIFQVVKELAGILNQADLAVTPTDLFDMFCHWLVAVHKFKFPANSVSGLEQEDTSTELEIDPKESILAAPFNQIFTDRGQAEWAFDFLRQSMELLGVEDPNDKRCTLTLPKNHKRNLLRFNFVTAVMIDFKGKEIKGGSGVDIALLENDSLNNYPKWGIFKSFPEPIAVYELPYNVVRNMTPEMAQHYANSFRYMGQAKATFGGSPFHHAHQNAIMEAIFDLEKRKQLFDNGLSTTGSEDDLDVDIDDRPGNISLQPTYTLAECAADTGFDEATLAEWLDAIERKGQAILYGPPGTGKTYLAEHLARLLVAGGDGIKDLVQFHSAYAYEDFIQGIRPQTTAEGQLAYHTVPGRFLEFCREAEKRSGTCVLIIDEINRANLSRVFGELMYLLEYRERDIPLAGGGRLCIPDNVRILGTMNTADRSIALVDHALRRRFVFIALLPQLDLLRDYHKDSADTVFINKLIQLLERLNQRIQDRNYAVGTSYFLRRNLRQSLRAIWRMEIEPYLEEYFFAQPDHIDEFRWHRVSIELGL